MSRTDIIQVILPAVLLLAVCVGVFLWWEAKSKKRQQRIDRVTKRRGASPRKAADTLSLRRTEKGALPIIGALLNTISPMASLRARIERTGLNLTPDKYVVGCIAITLVVGLAVKLLHKPSILAVLAALVMGLVIPHLVISYLATKRIKKFLLLFPDAIDFIVRGLRSGLPVTESMNMVGAEMEAPINKIFASMGESVRLGVPVEKALGDMSKKLGSTEFNFFVTSIILQRETGGNLSEILSNLSDVLRKRFMMRMKIKAMSSEAKASAMIVGALPFIVIAALSFISPNYLDPLMDDPKGNLAAAGACLSMTMGIFVMYKMTKFEI
jgi:tight adherence protein B